jgi:hypothetical protein
VEKKGTIIQTPERRQWQTAGLMHAVYDFKIPKAAEQPFLSQTFTLKLEMWSEEAVRDLGI